MVLILMANVELTLDLPPFDREAIEALHDRWIEQELAGNMPSLLELCTDDIEWVLPDGSTLRGREEIREWLDSLVADIRDIRISGRQVVGVGSIACLTSFYFTTYFAEDAGEEQHVNGAHLWILKKLFDGTWKVAMTTWT